MIRISAGASKQDVTPHSPVLLGGYGQRTTPSQGVHDPVEVTALCIGDQSPIILVTVDLISIPASLKTAIIDRLGVFPWCDSSRLILTATHSHSAPLPHDPADPQGPNSAFMDLLTHGILQAIESAWSHRTAARVVSKTGDVQIGFNRWRPDDISLVDTRIPVVTFIEESTESIIAVLFGAGCHPTTFGWDNMLVSSDYPGVAKRCIEDATPGAIAMFVNTTEGDVVPLTSPRCDALDPRGYVGTDDSTTKHIGRLLADEVIRCAHDTLTDATTAEGEIRFISTLADVIPNNAGLNDAEAKKLLDDATHTLGVHLGNDFIDKIPMSQLWAHCSSAVIAADMNDHDMREVMIACCYFLGLTARMARKGASVPLVAPLQAMIIDHAHFVFLPGEVLVGVGQLWSSLTHHADAFAVGLANAHLRYLPLAAHFAEEGADKRYETVTAGVAPGEVDRLVALAAEKLLTSMS